MPKKTNPAAEDTEFVIPTGLDHERLMWAQSFSVSQNGNLTKQGVLTDLKTSSGVSLPYRINVFRSEFRGENKWTWGIVLNPSKKIGSNEQDYSNLAYDDPYAACLGAMEELVKGGFELSSDAPLVSLLRSRFRKFVREEEA